MGERNILSYFPSFDSANRVKEELHNLGFEIVQVDRLGRMPQDGLNNPLTGQISSLTNLTLARACLTMQLSCSLQIPTSVDWPVRTSLADFRLSSQWLPMRRAPSRLCR